MTAQSHRDTALETTEHGTHNTHTKKRELLNIYVHFLVTFIGKQDQGSTATSTVHPIIFHSVQVLCNMSTAAGT